MNNIIETNQSYQKLRDLNSQTYYYSVASQLRHQHPSMEFPF